MKRPDKIQLSREDGEALRTRLAGNALTADDRRVLEQVLQWYFWLLFAVQEATVQPQAAAGDAVWREAQEASRPAC